MPAARLRVYCSRSRVRGTALSRVVLLSASLPRYKYIIYLWSYFINEQNSQIYGRIFV